MSLTPTLLEQVRATAKTHVEPIAQLTQRICEVPAPTGQELERARLVASLWQERGYTSEIDAVGNVYTRREGKNPQMPFLMLLAHIDTVFPASTPIMVKREGNSLFGPGIGDNCASVATMLHTFDLLDELHVQTETDIVAVANVGEEGLGNLLGAHTAVKRYQEHLNAVIAIDGSLGHITCGAVGSQRWKIVVYGPGGHSYGAFGTPSAIHGLGKIIAALANLPVPQHPKTTFNIGVIEGGTSVNTIAAEASALLDMRSPDEETLKRFARLARETITQGAGPGLRTEISVLGERPSGQRSRRDPLVRLAAEAVRWIGLEPHYEVSSTDANVPISMDIPAVCIGITYGENAHTLNESLAVSPLDQGLAHLTRLCIEACQIPAQKKEK